MSIGVKTGQEMSEEKMEKLYCEYFPVFVEKIKSLLSLDSKKEFKGEELEQICSKAAKLVVALVCLEDKQKNKLEMLSSFKHMLKEAQKRVGGSSGEEFIHSVKNVAKIVLAQKEKVWAQQQVLSLVCKLRSLDSKESTDRKENSVKIVSLMRSFLSSARKMSEVESILQREFSENFSLLKTDLLEFVSFIFEIRTSISLKGDLMDSLRKNFVPSACSFLLCVADLRRQRRQVVERTEDSLEEWRGACKKMVSLLNRGEGMEKMELEEDLHLSASEELLKTAAEIEKATRQLEDLSLQFQQKKFHSALEESERELSFELLELVKSLLKEASSLMDASTLAQKEIEKTDSQYQSLSKLSSLHHSSFSHLLSF